MMKADIPARDARLCLSPCPILGHRADGVVAASAAEAPCGTISPGLSIYGVVVNLNGV